MKNDERKIRAFIAVTLSDEIKETLREVTGSLKELNADVRLVKPENAHLTLKFLGNVDESKLEGVKTILETSLQDITAFEISFLGIGAFPNVNVPKVIWVGVSQRGEVLHSIRDMLEKNLSEIGIEKESRRYSSHLTVGRVKSGRGRNEIVSLLKANAGLRIGSMKASEIVLMQSMLKKEGPEYFPLKVVNLK